MKSWAIVVGINIYPPLAQQQPLQGAVADACDFADWALDENGGAVERDRLFFWTHPWPPAQQGRLGNYLNGGPSAGQAVPVWPPLWDNVAHGSSAPQQTRAPSASEIATTIEKVGRAARAAALEHDDQETRRVYVFLAGHGIRAKTFDRGEETCFLAGDFRALSSNLAAGLVPCDSLRRGLLNNRFDEAILFTDCCRQQTARSTLIAQPVSDYDGQPTAPHSIAYAAQDDMLAHETAGPSVRGAFSSALMRGLRTHRIGVTNDLHAAPLKQYVLDNIKEFTDSGQKPSMSFHPDGDGPLIVRGLPAIGLARRNRIINVSTLPPGTQLILNGGDNMPLPGFEPFIVAGPTLQLPPLPRGLYLIQIADGSGRTKMFQEPGVEDIHVG